MINKYLKWNVEWNATKGSRFKRHLCEGQTLKKKKLLKLKIVDKAIF